MTIGVDATFIRSGAVGGAEQMIRNLVTGLGATGGGVTVFARAGNWSDHIRGVELVEVPRRMNRFVASTYAAARFSDRHDVIYANYFVPPVVRRGHTVVAIINDAQYVHYPEFFSVAKRRWLRLAHRFSLKAAHRIVAISEFVREDLLAIYGDRWSDSIVTIPTPVSWDRLSPTKHLIKGPYILTVSAEYPHKNLTTLVKAFALARRRRDLDGVRLVIVGQCAAKLVSTDDKGQLDRAIEEAGIAHDVLRLGYVRDEDVGALYRDALAFVFPSLFEGFGMPAVEALGFGLPVITTRCAALPETTLGFARYVKDPLDAEELADTLVRVASCPAENRPSAEQVAAIRDAYNPVAVASRYRAMIGEVAL